MAERTVIDGAINLVLTAAIAATIAALLPDDSRPPSSPVVFVDAANVTPASPAELAAPASSAGSVEARITFAGDIMEHAPQPGGSFDESYARIAPILHKSDLAVGNLEFPVLESRAVGPDNGTVRFNGSPAHLDALKKAGFGLLSTANNHAFDQGIDGIRSTIDELERRQLRYVGTARTRDDLRRQLVVIDVHGIRVAFFAYTGLLNTYLKDDLQFEDPPSDLSLAFADFSEWDREYREIADAMFRADAERARRAGADFVVALTHWGEEWTFAPTGDQREAARDLLGAGFDLVVGGHGHVLNAPEIHDGKLIVYSLGNLFCDFAEWQARTGALLDVVVRRDADGRTRLVDFRMHPLLVRREGHVIEPLDQSAETATGEAAEAWQLARRMLGPAIFGEHAEPAR